MKEYTPGHFVAAIRDVRFETPRMQHAQTVFLAMSPREQAAVTRACSGLRNISGVGMVTAFEIMVATAQLLLVDDRKHS